MASFRIECVREGAHRGPVRVPAGGSCDPIETMLPTERERGRCPCGQSAALGALCPGSEHPRERRGRVRVGVALPVIITDLDLDLTDAQWVNSLYSVVFAALLLSTGRLGDRIGRRRLFLAGLVVFLAAARLAVAPRPASPSSVPAQTAG